MNDFSYGILEDDRLSGNFLKCYVSIKTFWEVYENSKPLFSHVILNRIDSYGMQVLEDWKALEDDTYSSKHS